MLSLLFGLAGARSKHVSRNKIETQKGFLTVKTPLEPFVSDGKRYYKVYRAKESVVPVSNGGQRKVVEGNNCWDVYIDQSLIDAIGTGMSVSALIGCIPGLQASELATAIVGLGYGALKSTSRGNGVVIRVQQCPPWPLGMWAQ